ncbi:hypothetical protein GZ212_03305 [Mangrovimonas sp. CR14]|uniref:hypothetical protein n=1 Tax=Mangrovimonas sp. CR14 TaxID=2706120 RepID=UPI00141E31CB|nr:hypothetical protein [Mangrovimonas sp. CR14]NIK91169.1 hypothetical protein [Mangrovimonas sp. CR14]
MKTLKFTISLLLLLVSVNVFSQKLDPDVELISELVQQKQEEIKQRVLKNLVVKNIKTTNYTTYNTMYNLVEILSTEKNKTVMTKSLITEISNYSINYVLANYFIDYHLNNDPSDQKKAYVDLFGTYGFIPDKSTGKFVFSDTTFNSLNEKIDKIGYINKCGVDFKSNADNNQIMQVSKIKSSLEIEFNFIVDELFEILVDKEINLFTSNGLFLKKSIEYRFKSGFSIDYSNSIPDERRQSIKSELNEFVNKLNTYAIKGNEIYDMTSSLINDGQFNINSLKDLDNSYIQKLFGLFAFSLQGFKDDIGENSFLARIGEIISKYVIYEFNINNPDVVFNTFKIDIESIIISLEEEFYDKSLTNLKKHKIGVKPFFTIGLNYGLFTGTNTSIPNNDNSDDITDIAFVSEKLGIKFMLFDFDYTRSQKPMDWYLYKGTYRRWVSPPKDPLINDIYISFYGSGVIYNVVDLKSQDNFNFAIAGVGTGVSFFNDLELNISYSVPIIEKSLSFDNAMLMMGFDIPIFEYIRALRDKSK